MRKDRKGECVLKRQIGILIVEDSKYEVQAIKDFAKNKENYKIVGVADNVNDGIKLVMDTHPDIIILDFALKASVGSVLIEKVRATKLDMQPFIIVISNAIDEATKQGLMEIGANICLIKGDLSENPSQIFHCIEGFFGHYLKRTGQEAQLELEVVSETEKQSRLENRLNKDFEKMGYTLGKRTYKYIRDIILKCVSDKNDNPVMVDLYAEIGRKYGCEANVMDQAINRSIIKAFSENYYDETVKLYTPECGKNRGKPSVREFICHFIKIYIDESY